MHASEDEEAIYAYHISLKDATRAAADRKNSQNSTQAVKDEQIDPASPMSAIFAPISNDDDAARTPTLPVDWCGILEMKDRIAQERRLKLIEAGESASRRTCESETTANSEVRQCDYDEHAQSTRTSAGFEDSLMGNYHPLNDGSQSSAWLPDVTITTTSGAQLSQIDKKKKKKKKHLKSTNPFLSDSFDFT